MAYILFNKFKTNKNGIFDFLNEFLNEYLNNHFKNTKMDKSNSNIGVLGFLGLLLVTLKLTRVIDWSWWYVTLPFWGVGALFIFVIVLLNIIRFFGK